MFRSYLLRFFFRLGVMIVVLSGYFKNRAALDFTARHGLFAPVHILWGILAVSFALQLSPRSRVSRGCRKQFSATFERVETVIDDFLRGVTLESVLADGATAEKNCDGDAFDDQRGENDKNAGACYASRKNL